MYLQLYFVPEPTIDKDLCQHTGCIQYQWKNIHVDRRHGQFVQIRADH